MAELLVLLAIFGVAGYIMWNWAKFKVRFTKVRHNKVTKGKTIVVDRTKPDTSKEDELRDKYGL